jgi:hypothetical protein
VIPVEPKEAVTARVRDVVIKVRLDLSEAEAQLAAMRQAGDRPLPSRRFEAEEPLVGARLGEGFTACKNGQTQAECQTPVAAPFPVSPTLPEKHDLDARFELHAVGYMGMRGEIILFDVTTKIGDEEAYRVAPSSLTPFSQAVEQFVAKYSGTWGHPMGSVSGCIQEAARKMGWVPESPGK